MDVCIYCGDEFKRDCKQNNMKYCSYRCRQNHYNEKNREANNIYQKDRYYERLLNSGKELVKCLICGKSFVQVGSHIVQNHNMTCREYREKFKLEVKAGVVPAWYKKKKGDTAVKNDTYKNLESGEKYRFIKGDKRAGRYKRSPITLERVSKLGKKTWSTNIKKAPSHKKRKEK